VKNDGFSLLQAVDGSGTRVSATVAWSDIYYVEFLRRCFGNLHVFPAQNRAHGLNSLPQFRQVRVGAKWVEKWGTAVPLSVGGRELGLRLTQFRLGRGLYLRTKWHLDPRSPFLATIDMGRKLGAAVSLSVGESWVPI